MASFNHPATAERGRTNPGLLLNYRTALDRILLPCYRYVIAVTLTLSGC